MATNDKTPAAPAVETSFGGSSSASVTMDEGGNRGKPQFRQHDGSGVKADLTKDTLEVETRGGADEPGDELDEDLGGDEDLSADDAGAEGTDEDAAGEPEDLGEYDPQNAEVVQKFETAYLSDAGGPNLQALMAEHDRNEQAGDGKLNDGTYQFLSDRFGLSVEEIKDIEAGQRAKRDAQASQLNAAIDEAGGGRQRVEAMVEWGKKGGYTKAQRDKFTKDMSSGDPEVAAAAVALLATRYEKATGSQRPGARRGVTPQRDVTAGARKSSGVEGYKTHGEYRDEFRKARESKDAGRIEAVRKRLQASPWYKRK